MSRPFERGVPRPRVVFDCNIFLQAAVSSAGPAFACFEMAEGGVFTLVISADVLSEVRSILTRVDVQKKFPGLTPNLVSKFLMRIAEVGVFVSPVPLVIVFERDHKDEPYLNLARASSAAYLITRDRDMLDLMVDRSSEGQSVRNTLPGLRFLDPVSFLREIRNAG